jgi:hypothetical protein
MKTKSMKTKSLLPLSCALVLLCLGGQANAALTITNGDFQSNVGLTAQPGAPGWYQGVPAGWSSSTTNLNYNVINYNSGNLGANIQTLGPASPFAPLYQSAGLLDSTGKVTLTFNILGISGPYGMAAGIYRANLDGTPVTNFSSLATASYTESSGSLQTLEVLNVAAGTRVGVAFWSWAGAPGVDNVSVIPEPSTGSMMALGLAGLVTTRLLRRKSS